SLVWIASKSTQTLLQKECRSYLSFQKAILDRTGRRPSAHRTAKPLSASMTSPGRRTNALPQNLLDASQARVQGNIGRAQCFDLMLLLLHLCLLPLDLILLFLDGVDQHHVDAVVL